MTSLLLSRFRYSPDDGQICVRILVKGESHKRNCRDLISPVEERLRSLRV